MARYNPPEIIAEALKKYDEACKGHKNFVRHFERMERAYRGILEPKSGASKWRHRLHPPIAFNLIETVVANTIEQGLQFAARPSPKVNVSLDEAMEALAQADAVEYLIRHEHRVDDMDEKQRPLFLCAAIGGTGFGKEYWSWMTGPSTRNAVEEQPVYDEFGNVLGHVPTLKEVTEIKTISDHSTCEVVDPRDMIIHDSARSLQPTEPGGAQCVFHRCWYSFEQLKLWESSGFVKNVDMLKESLDFADEYWSREKQLFDMNRQKDLIEVLEYWYFKDGQVWRSMIGNRVVLLREPEPSPFHHGQYPFFNVSMQPGLFSPRGVGTMELIVELQEMLWELMNHRLDNVELINNFVTLIRSDVDDPEAFELFPGAKWQVEDPRQIEAFHPPYQLAELTLSAEQYLRGDLQNVTAAAPFVSGTESATVDQKTATGASIVMNAAQQAMAAKKYQAMRGLAKEVQMRLGNLKQFMTEDKLIHIVGADGAVSFQEISPLQIQAEYAIELEPMGESLMRQERRAEALQLSQVMAQMAPLMQSMGTPLNMQEVLRWALKLWDIPDAERFFSQMQSPQVAGMGQPGGGGGGGGNTPGAASLPADLLGNLGITAGSAVDASSPSAVGGISGSPVAALQRAATLSGGAANA